MLLWLSRRRAWALDHPLAVVVAVALVVSAVGFACTRPVLLVNDGDAYMEMARAMRHGSLEVQNGLAIVDSPELRIVHTVQRGAHQYAKYPALYALLAVLPYAGLGVRGMYLLNALCFAAFLPAFYLVARRVLSPGRALGSTLLLVVGLPLASYMLIELPHLVSLALASWSVVLWDASRGAHRTRRAAGLGVASGLLMGWAFGVRLQDVVLLVPLLAIGGAYGRRRAATVGGMCVGAAACAVAMGAFNQRRFGTPNPFSYGPAAPEETAEHFLRPTYVVVAAILLGGLLVARRVRSRVPAWLVGACCVAAVLAVPEVRGTAERMAGAAASAILNASIAGAGWGTPEYTHDWMDKALLVCAPSLVLGLVSAVRSCARRTPPVTAALGWMVVLTIVFLSARDPDVRSGRGAMGFMFLSPRYLVDVMPWIYLLTWRELRATTFRVAHGVLGALLGLALLLRMFTDRDDLSGYRVLLLTNGSIALAALALLSFALRRSRPGAGALALAVALCHGWAGACVLGEDAVAYTTLAATFERWQERVLAVVPDRVALVGWGFAKDPVFAIRARRSVVTVDPAADDAASLTDVLDALTRKGYMPFYYGYGDELDTVVRSRIAGRYGAVQMMEDPPLWRLQAVTTP